MTAGFANMEAMGDRRSMEYAERRTENSQLERRRPNLLHGEAEKWGDSWSRPGVQGGILKRGDIGCSCTYPECSSRQGEPAGAEEPDSNCRSKGERRFWKTEELALDESRDAWPKGTGSRACE